MSANSALGRYCKFGTGGAHFPPDVGFTTARDAKGKPAGMVCPTCRERRAAGQRAAKAKAKA